MVRRYQDHIRHRECADQADIQNTDIVEVLSLPVSEPEDEVLEFAVSTTTNSISAPTNSISAPLRRSARTCQPPSHLIEETSN